MGKVIFDVSMSLDGPEEPIGDGGQRLHEWASDEDERNRKVLEEGIAEEGAVITGRETYDTCG